MQPALCYRVNWSLGVNHFNIGGMVGGSLWYSLAHIVLVFSMRGVKPCGSRASVGKFQVRKMTVIGKVLGSYFYPFTLRKIFFNVFEREKEQKKETK